MSEPKILIPGSYTTEILIWLLWGRVQAVGGVCVYVCNFPGNSNYSRGSNNWANLVKLVLKYEETMYSVSRSPRHI